jgi:hypothetical protein
MQKEEIIDSSYKRVIRETSLDVSHFQQLLDRGISEESIKDNGYVTFSGVEEEKVNLGLKIKDEVGNCSFVVPGIFRANGENNSNIPVLNTNQGLGIPSRDYTGRLKGFRIRTEGPGGKKYLHLSSKKFGGPSIVNSVHFPRKYNNEEEVFLTEGPLKADVATELMGSLVLATQSITATECLKTDLKGLGVRRVVVAYDKDLETNAAVARATAKTMRLLLGCGYEVGVATWEIDEKGIDDAIKAGGVIDTLEVDEAKEYLEKVFLKLGLREVNWEGESSDPIEKDFEYIDWGKITALPSISIEPEKFKSEDIPEFAREYATEVADQIQAPIEYLLVTLISTISSLIGVLIKIRPKAKDNWEVVVNLWALVIGAPSSYKSPMMRAILKLLDDHIKLFHEQHLEEMKKFRALEKSLKIRSKSIEDGIKEELKKSQPKKKKIAELEKSLLEIENELDTGKPKERRIILNDSTPEATTKVLTDNKNGILMYRDEIAGLIQSCNKPGRENERAMYLEGFNGNVPTRTDRISREDDFLEYVCISIVGAIQPGVLDSILLKSHRDGGGNDGFMERFQLAVSPNLSKSWKYIDREFDPAIEERVKRVIDSLVFIHEVIEEPISLRFSMEAQSFFKEWCESLVNRVRGKSNTDDASVNHLGKYTSLMPSLSLIFHVCDLVDKGEDIENSKVGLESAKRAARWCDILEQHAAKIYSSAANVEVSGAYSLLERIKSGEVRNGFPVRSIYRKGWQHLSNKQAVYKALDILETVNIARVKKEKGPKGASSPVIEINPEVYDA